ncbi:hypothetical protein CO614_02850 [Lysobacteraceae bacterium NML120232]|nr:hypothetical protein CO608_05860 [Xanthomonadaceae bacterium NML08-0793]PJK12998.1 hypothetical protein CO614_02850 [Xanthomonadaceae bacterium NML120232]
MKSWIWCGLLPMLAACQAAPEATLQPAAQMEMAQNDAEEAAKLRAQQAAKAFSERLQAALKEKLGSEGPVAAIGFCKAEAPGIAAAVAKEHGVQIGRIPVPHRVRNPQNAIDGWQSKVLEDFRNRVASGAVPSELSFVSSQQLPEGVALRMMKAIEVQPACLACHGQQLAEPVRTALAQNYPEDTATGFEAGDLRGALWVEVPSSPVVSNQGENL